MPEKLIDLAYDTKLSTRLIESDIDKFSGTTNDPTVAPGWDTKNCSPFIRVSGVKFEFFYWKNIC